MPRALKVRRKLARTGDSGLQLVGKKWQAVAYHHSLPSRKAQSTFPSKTDARRWKEGLESDLHALHTVHVELVDFISYDKKKNAWSSTVPAGSYALRHYPAESRNFGSLAKAIAFYQKTESDRNAGAASKADRDKTLDEVIDKWLEKHERAVEHSTFAKDRGLVLNHIKPLLGEYPALSVDLNILEEWKGSLEAKGCSANTVAISIKKLSQIFIWSIPRKYVKYNPVTGLSAPSVERKKWRPLTKEEVETLCKLTGETEVILSFIYTALRVSELFALQVRHVSQLEEETARHILVEQHVAFTASGNEVLEGTKTHQTRKVPITSDFLPIVRELIAGKSPNDYLFNGLQPLDPTKPRRALDPTQRLNANSFLRNRLKPAFEKMGVDGAFHLLRKTSASLLLEHYGNTDAALVKISRCLGHKDVATTLRFYVEIYQEGTREAMTALDGLFGDRGNVAAKEELIKATKADKS